MRDIKIGGLSPWGFVLASGILFLTSYWVYASLPLRSTAGEDTAQLTAKLTAVASKEEQLEQRLSSVEVEILKRLDALERKLEVQARRER